MFWLFAVTGTELTFVSHDRKQLNSQEEMSVASCCGRLMSWHIACASQEQHWRRTRLQRFCTLLAEIEAILIGSCLALRNNLRSMLTCWKFDPSVRMKQRGQALKWHRVCLQPHLVSPRSQALSRYDVNIRAFFKGTSKKGVGIRHIVKF